MSSSYAAPPLPPLPLGSIAESPLTLGWCLTRQVLRDPSSGKTLGQANFSLRTILDDGTDEHSVAHTLQARDASGMAVGELMVTVRALEALTLVDREENPGRQGGRAGSRDGRGRDEHGGHDGGRDSSRDRSRSRERGRDPGPQELEVNVGELRLNLPRGTPTPRRVQIRVEALGVEEAPLETRGMAPSAGSAPVRFDWSHVLPLERPGERAWDALSKAVAECQAKGLDMYFVLLDATSGAALGEAPLSLLPVLEASGGTPSFYSQQLTLKDPDKRTLGTLGVKVRAYDALQAVQAAADRPRAERGPPKSVEDLSRDELHAVLAARGERLPQRLQTKQYYLDIAAKLKLRQVRRRAWARRAAPPPSRPCASRHPRRARATFAGRARGAGAGHGAAGGVAHRGRRQCDGRRDEPD